MAHGAGAGPGRQRGDPGDPAAQRRPIGAYTGERVMRPAHHRGGHATRAERGEDSAKEMGGREFLKKRPDDGREEGGATADRGDQRSGQHRRVEARERARRQPTDRQCRGDDPQPVAEVALVHEAERSAGERRTRSCRG